MGSYQGALPGVGRQSRAPRSLSARGRNHRPTDASDVVATYGRGETADGQMWIALQYVEGTTAEAASLAGAMTPVRALRVTSEVAEVLDLAHSFGIVHQDVKPSNV